MAPQLGPDANTRTILLGLGKSAHGRTATFYTDAAATALAAILTYDGTGTPGAAVSGSQLTIDADSAVPLTWFPDGYDTLYVRVNGLSGIKTINADYDARLDAQVTAGGLLAPKASPTFTGTVTAAAVTASGLVTAAGGLRHTGSTLGFYNATAVTKPTGVTVDAAGIHAALVTLGLIAA
jgi:hypothetical protein